MSEPGGCDHGVDTGRRRWLTVVVLQCLVSACGGGGDEAPNPTSSAPPSIPPSPAPGPTTAPPITGDARVFTFARELSYAVGEGTKHSRYVLYDSGAFVLEFVNLEVEFRGRYVEASGVVDFSWEGSSVAGPWGATGTMNGDSLEVHYNVVMQMNDFEDAVYARTR